MILSNVLTACNANPLYCHFIPIFIKSWKALIPTIQITIIFVHDKLLPELEPYKEHIILFPPIPGIKTPFIAQVIRILYPAIVNTNNGVLITDMDMVPMNKKYYVDSITQHSSDKFICYRHILQDKQQLPICYNIAIPKVWKEIFNIHNINDIVKFLQYEYSTIEYDGNPGKAGWSTDQRLLYREVMKWNSKTNNFIALHDWVIGLSRLNRVNNIVFNDELVNKIKKGAFSDYHMKRPYRMFKELNDNIVDQL